MKSKIYMLMSVMIFCLYILLTGCSLSSQPVRQQSVDSDIEMLADGSIILSGGVDEDTYKEFYRFTSTGKKHYTLRIMTHGGCAFNTVAIMNRIEILQKQGVKFTMIVPAHAFSAGAYIFMMGDERIMYRGSQLMWHTMTGQAAHDGKQIPMHSILMVTHLDRYAVGKFMERFPHLSQDMVDTILWNSGMSWMTEEEALRLGIATSIVN